MLDAIFKNLLQLIMFNTLKNSFPKDIFKYLVIGSFGMGVFNTVKTARLRKLQGDLDLEKERYRLLSEEFMKLSKQRADCLESNNEICKKTIDLLKQFSDLKEKVEKTKKLESEILESETISEDKNQELIDLTEEVTTSVKTTNDNLENVLDLVNSHENISNIAESGINFHEIIQYIYSSMRDIYSSLNFEQVVALTHISGGVALLLCLISLITVFYSEKLILYYNLEEKYPKLAKYIKLRRKFQNYYFIWNTFLMIIIIIAIIYINILILTI